MIFLQNTRNKFKDMDGAASRAEMLDLLVISHCPDAIAHWLNVGIRGYNAATKRIQRGVEYRHGMSTYREQHAPANTTETSVQDAVARHLDVHTHLNPEKKIRKFINEDVNGVNPLHRHFCASIQEIPRSTYIGVLNSILDKDETRLRKMCNDHNKCRLCLWMEELERELERKMKTASGDELKFILEKWRKNKKNYHAHMDVDVEMRTLFNFLTDVGIRDANGQSESFDVEEDFRAWQDYQRVRDVVEESIDTFWRCVLEPMPEKKTGWYLPTTCDGHDVNSTLFDCVTDELSASEEAMRVRIGFSSNLFFARSTSENLGMIPLTTMICRQVVRHGGELDMAIVGLQPRSEIDDGALDDALWGMLKLFQRATSSGVPSASSTSVNNKRRVIKNVKKKNYSMVEKLGADVERRQRTHKRG